MRGEKRVFTQIGRRAARMIARIARLSAAVLCLATALGSPVRADTVLAPPPDKFVISAGGVDMRSGRYNYSHTDLSIGGDSGLELTRTMTQLGKGHTNPFGSFSHNFDIYVQLTSVNMQTNDFRPNAGADPQVEVIFGGRAQTFRTFDGGSWNLVSHANYGILTPAPVGDAIPSPGILTYRDSDGTTMTFRPIGSTDCPGAGLCGYVSQLTRPDGTALAFQYDNDPVTAGLRLRSVTSTRGQALLFEYSGMYVTKACALSLAVTVKPANNLCPAGVPTAVYAYDSNAGSQRLASVTDPGGALWKFVNGTTTDSSGSFTPASMTMGFINPGDTQPWLTHRIYRNEDDYGSAWDVITAQTFSDGRSYTYDYDIAPPAPPHRPVLAGGTMTDAQGHRTTVRYDFPELPGTGPGSPCHFNPCEPTQINPDGSSTVVFQMTSGPVQVSDPLGRTTYSNYCDTFATDGCHVTPEAVSMTDPSGILTKLTWDFTTHHLGQTDEVARSGSLPDIIRSEGYACDTAAMIKSCDKPSAITDAKGNTTLFTYAPEHGGVLTEMQPPPAPGAPRPLKLTTWVQKFAYYKNSSGVLAAAPTPVYVINSESVCQTVAGSGNGNPVCDAAAPKRVTTYEYGANGTANNLFVRGIVVTADGTSRRTCYSYDNFGNRIAQTSPRAGLATCP